MKDSAATDQEVSIRVEEWRQFVATLRECPDLPENDYKKGIELRREIEEAVSLLPSDRAAKIEWEMASIDDQFRFFTKVSASSSPKANGTWWESRVPLHWGGDLPNGLGGPVPPLAKRQKAVRVAIATVVLGVSYFFWIETKIAVAYQCVILLHGDALRFKEVNHRWPRTKGELRPSSSLMELSELEPTFQPMDKNRLIATTNAWGFFGRTRSRHLMTAQPMRLQELPTRNAADQGQ